MRDFGRNFFITFAFVYTMRRLKYKIHHEGTNILISLAAILAVINAPLWIWVRPLSWAIACTAVCTIFYLLVVNFFRSPRRAFPGDPKNCVVSAADGTVVALEETYEPEFLKCRCIQLSVFMSVLNVHANWFPVNGTVKHVSHNNGRFMAAYLPKSSTENERSAVVITTKNGVDVLARQIAGALARRIVTYAKVGEKCHVDEQMGFIKFGSRVDVYLPVGTEVLIEMDQKVTGNQTPIARLSKCPCE